MADYITGKSILVTGAGGGFGRLISEKAAGRGTKLTCTDVDADGLAATAALISDAGGTAITHLADVTSIEDMKAAVRAAVAAHGRVDVIVNNAGVMPLAFYADHEAALEKWHRCLDINIKGILNGIVAVYDQMMAQGAGHVVNISSIYGNYPVVGAGVYGATKAAVNVLSESLRVETRGKIKVTIVKPTGVPTTGLGAGVVNPEAVVGIVGQNALEFGEVMGGLGDGTINPGRLDPEEMDYVALDPGFIADQVLHAINQPPGVSIGDITVRASGDHYIL